MGRNVRAALAAAAERKLVHIRFNGRSRNCTFDGFTSPLREHWKDLGDDDLVKVMMNNLPENFPCSLILDLFAFSDTPL